MPIASELTINTSATALDMANAIFGPGISVTEASFNGDPLAAGTYSGALGSIPGISPSDSGVILSTGRVADFTNSSGTTDTNVGTGTGFNNAGVDGDAQLNAVAGMTTFDAAILQASFIPDGDYLTMQFVFSSEEYPEYINQNFNDAFGVWVNGTFVPVSITIVGNVSIDEINGGENENFYRDNTGDQFNTEMDGFTYVLSLKAPVNAGQVNTIKIAIADGGDTALDSNLLIMSESIQTVTLAFDDDANVVAGGSRTFDILANDSNSNGTLVITQIQGTNVVAGQTVTLASGQQVRLNADGTITVFATSTIGIENFSYTVSDNGVTDVGYVSINTSAAGALDGIVSGTTGDDFIDAFYTADIDGDRVDNNDATGVMGTTGNGDVIQAGAGNDYVLAGLGNDIIEAGTGNDIVDGGAGNDRAELGAGNDSYQTSDPLASGNDTVLGEAGNDAVLTGDGNDVIFGGTGNDSLQGGAGADGLYGGDDADRLLANAGDLVVGGEGGNDNDTLVASGVASLLYGGGNNEAGTLTFTDGSTLQFSQIEKLELNGGNPDGIIFGTAGNDVVGAGYVDANGDVIDNNDSILTTPQSTNGDEVYAGDGDDTVFALLGDDFVYGGAGNDSIEGGANNDYMQGDSGNDIVDAGDGNDFIRGDAGNDFVYGGAGDDSTYGGAGNDQVFGGLGNDQMFGGFGDDTVYGGDGNDTVTGSGDTDVVYGDDGDDSIQGSYGNDTLYGGAGNDTMLGEEDADSFYAGAGDYVDGYETVISGTDNDTLYVNGPVSIVWDTLNPENGTITFTATGGTLPFYNIEHVFVDGTEVFSPNYVVDGTAGNDRIDVNYVDAQGDRIDANDNLASNNDDVVIAGTGTDTVSSGAGNDLIYAGEGNDLLYAGDGNDTVVGEDGSDALYGGGGSNTLFGGAGDDNLDAGTGASLLYGGADNDGLHGSVGNDTFYGGDGRDSVWADAGNDLVHGGLGDDWLSGFDGDDTVYGEDGDDIILGGFGADQLFGELGNDNIDSGGGNDLVDGGAGNDAIFSFSGADTLEGGAGDDRLEGGADSDSIDGGDGNDTLDGGTENDTLIGGAGDDQSSGGLGSDRFLLADGFGFDTILGGEDAGNTDFDILDASANTEGSEISFSGNEAGTYTNMGSMGGVVFSEIELLVLGSGRDSVVGDNATGGINVDLGTGNDLAYGGVGVDTIVAGAGEDIVQGGQGNDLIDLGGPDGSRDLLNMVDGDGSDIVSGFEAPIDNGDGTFTGLDLLEVSSMTDASGNPINVLDVVVSNDGSGNAVLTFPNGESITLIGITPASVVSQAALIAMGIPPAGDGIVSGTSGDDVIDALYVGDSDGDRIDNNDALGVLGTSGNDDVIQAGDGNDFVLAGFGNDIIDAGLGDDAVDGRAGNDWTEMGAGNDIYQTSSPSVSGNDTVYGDSGNDGVMTGDGNDLIYGGSGNDNLLGMAGNDIVYGGVGDDTVSGGSLDDSLFGDDGNDRLYGFTGVDSLFGGAGSDTLDGGQGADALQGGDDQDTFIGTEGDIVDGGEGGTDNDKLQLVDVLNVAYGGGNNEAGTVTFNGGATLAFQNIENLIFGGRDGVVNGTAGNDVIGNGFVDAQGDAIDANDAILPGDVGNDDLVQAGAGNDMVNAGAGDDVVYGGTENDTLAGQLGSDTLYGGDGQDLFLIADDHQGDTIEGGADFDAVVFSNASSTQGVTVTFTGADAGTYAFNATPGTGSFSQIEHVHGTDYADTFIGTAATSSVFVHGDMGNDTVTGGMGADSLTGDEGADVLNGGAGADTIEGGSDADRITGGAGDVITGGETTTAGGTDNDILIVEAGSMITYGGGTNEAGTIALASGGTLIFSEIEQVVFSGPVDGTAGNDTMNVGYTDLNGDQIDGSDGDIDVIYGYVGNDSITAGDSNDTIYGGTGDDTVNGGADEDVIYGEDGNDTLNGDSGRDTLYGGSGNDALDGGENTDFVYGGAGDDTIVDSGGAQSDDTLYGGDGNDTIGGGEREDSISGDAGNDQLSGDVGNDTLFGGDGADTIYGGADSDEVYGGDGGDLVNAGTGNDSVFGGADTDTIALQSPMGIDSIVGGETGADFDTIDMGGHAGAVSVTYTGDEAGSITAAGSGTATFLQIENLVLTTGNDTVDASADTVGVYVSDTGGNDTILGGSGNDTVYSGSGSDTIAGGLGNDVLYGGTWDDVFVVEDNFGTDQMEGGSGYDVIDLSALTGAVNVVLTGNGAGTVTNGGNVITFTSIEQIRLTDQADVVDASASTDGQMYFQSLGGNDTIVGGSGDDVFDDEAGLPNGQGNDVFYGGAGNDTLWVGMNDDIAYGGIGNDGLHGQEGNDSLFGGEGDDLLHGYSGADSLTGGAGNDTLDVGSADSLVDYVALADGDGEDIVSAFEAPIDNGDGTFTGLDLLDVSDLTDASGTPVNVNDVIVTDDGSGNAVLTFPNGEAITLIGIAPSVLSTPAALVAIGIPPAADFVVDGTAAADLMAPGYVDFQGDIIDGADGDNDTIFGYAGNDTIQAGVGDDIAYGGIGDDEINGDAGNDTLEGGAGNDRLFGGDDDDRLLGGDGDDFIDGGTGQDTIDAGEGNDGLNGGARNDLIFGGAGTDAVDGGDGDDTIYGGSEADDLRASVGDDQVYGGDGNDRVLGGDGNDTLFGAAGTDTLEGSVGDDLIDGGDGNDSVSGGSGNDTLLGDLGNDTIDGLEGNDSLVGGDGDDSLFGWQNDDTLTGGIGNDLVDGDDGNDQVFGGAGTDTLIGDAGNDTLTAGDDNDQIYAGTGNDSVVGSAGDDLVFAAEGNDTLTGDAGNDSLFGGDDRDTFFGGVGDVIDGGEGGDDNDVLDLSSYTHAGTNVIYTLGDPESGIVEFLDGAGVVTGTLAFSNIENVVACFTLGCMIQTERGEVAVEELQPGDKVLTRDDGMQPIRWVGRRDLSNVELARAPQFSPIRIERGALGYNLPQRDMMISPQHRMLVTGARAELLFGDAEVLVAATHMVGMPGVQRVYPRGISYVHILFDQHQIVRADGVWSESFQPGAQTLSGLETTQRDEVLALFPHLKDNDSYPSARMKLKAKEARALLQT